MITLVWTSTIRGAARRICHYIVRTVHDSALILLLIVHVGKLLAAWSKTPTKWYPLPLAVGALLLVAIQYRHKLARVQKEVDVNDEGHEVIKLKGPWQVCVLCRKSLFHDLLIMMRRFTFWALCRYEICHEYGAMSTPSNCQSGSVHMVSVSIRLSSVAIWMRSSLPT